MTVRNGDGLVAGPLASIPLPGLAEDSRTRNWGGASAP